jgi:hypothetical protein
MISNLDIRPRKRSLSRLLGATSLVIIAALPQAAWAQGADQPAPSAQPAGDDEGQAIVVTGFRESLSAALNVKRQDMGIVDAIVADDIAAFPDQN